MRRHHPGRPAFPGCSRSISSPNCYRRPGLSISLSYHSSRGTWAAS